MATARENPLRAFISYSTKDKLTGAEVKAALSELGIECFLAHDDIRVSEEWKARIIDELRKASIFVPLLSKAFVESEWAPQEVGFIVARPEVLIIPLLLDSTIPFGFISHIQGRRYLAEAMTSEFFIETISNRFPRQLIPVLIDKMRGAVSFRKAEHLMKPLVPIFEQFDDSEIDAFVEASISNREIWDAALCRSEYLPRFIELHHKRIKRAKLKALAYQIEKGEWYQK